MSTRSIDPAYWRQRAQAARQAAATVRPETKPIVLEIAAQHEARAERLELSAATIIRAPSNRLAAGAE